MTEWNEPENRGHLPTERRPHGGHDLDELSTTDCVDRLIDAQRPAVDAVAGASTALAALADDTVAAIRDGGRLIYLGAGTSG
ncbi:MAG: N-acetylmuramic acid 6-phosphate etherase, partial [Planctomycetota bacterium]